MFQHSCLLNLWGGCAVMPDTKPSLTTIVFMQVKTLFPVSGIGETVSGNMESHNTATP